MSGKHCLIFQFILQLQQCQLICQLETIRALRRRTRSFAGAQDDRNGRGKPLAYGGEVGGQIGKPGESRKAISWFCFWGPHPPLCATCPLCGARKMLRAYAGPCSFRPLRKKRTALFCHWQRQNKAVRFSPCAGKASAGDRKGRPYGGRGKPLPYGGAKRRAVRLVYIIII